MPLSGSTERPLIPLRCTTLFVKCSTALWCLHDCTVIPSFNFVYIYAYIYIKLVIMESNNITIMHLADETLLQILSYDILHRQDQHHLALVSRRFSTLVAVILYNTIEYLSYRSWRNPQIALLSRTCHEHPERAALVRHLSLSWIHDDEEGRFQIMDLLTQVPMLRSLVLIVQGDQELEDSPDPPSKDCPNPTHFFDRCPMIFLRSLKVHCPRTTSNEVIKYTHLQSLESLEIKYFDILQPFESSSNITESGDTISVLKHLKFTYSIMPTRPVVEVLVGHLNSLQSLDWEIYNVIDVIEWDSALSSHLLSLSKTLVKLRLVQHAFYQGFANDSEIDFTAYTALKDLSIDSCFVFSSKPARDIRQGGGKPLHYRLPSLLETLEVSYIRLQHMKSGK